jgi:hypothetical protein
MQISDSKLPTKDEHAATVYKIATDPGHAGTTRLEALRLYAEIMGFIPVRHSAPPSKP